MSSLPKYSSIEMFRKQGSPDGMFTAGPVSEDDFFTWEALICGPKDTPFVSYHHHRSSLRHILSGGHCKEGGVFLAKLTFVSAVPPTET